MKKMNEKVNDHPDITELEKNGFIDEIVSCYVCDNFVMKSQAIFKDNYFCSNECYEVFVEQNDNYSLDRED